jgi:hypothetical protein
MIKFLSVSHDVCFMLSSCSTLSEVQIMKG